MPQIKKNGKRITINLDSEVYKELEEYCKAVGQNKTEAIENILDHAIKEFGLKNEKERRAY